MAYYMYRAAYTPEAWAAQIQNPEDPRERIGPMFEALGGRIVEWWYAFGEYDIVLIGEFPDNVSAAAGAVAAGAGGAVKVAETTVLMTVEEGLAALTKAGESAYRPPSG